MRQIIVALPGAVLSVACAPGAMAADMPAKTRIYTTAPVHSDPNWTGWYVGANAGYGWGNSKVSLTPGSGWTTLGNAAAAQYLIDNGSPALKSNGALGGLQAGYNFQSGHVVYGVETDFSFANINSTRSTGVVTPPAAALIFPRSFTESDKLDWLVTARGRLGYATGNALIYATGGLAVGHRKFTQNLTTSTAFNQNFGSTTATKAGWTVGGGLEYALIRNWSVKGEYLYVDLGSVSVFSDSDTAPGFGLTVATSSKLTLSIARLGLNYKFE